MERFLRTEKLLGKRELNCLARKRVAVVGIGAVGGYALEILARYGVGKFILIDFDKVDITNINRQILALSYTVGRDKVEIAKERVVAINPSAEVEMVKKPFRTKEDAEVFFRSGVDFIIDAIDSLAPKVNLLCWIRKNEVPHISSMGAALKFDPFSVRVGSLFSTKNCSLARFVRKRLRRLGVSDGITVVYSSELVDKSGIGEYGKTDMGRKRRVIGSLPSVPAIFGIIAADYAVKEMLMLNPDCVLASGK